MSALRFRLRAAPVAFILSALGLGLGSVGACSSLNGEAAGSQCFSALDCAAGLVCIPKGSIRFCSSDLTSIETEIDSGLDAGAGLGDGPIPKRPDGALVDSGAPPVDSTVADVVTPPPPHDAGHDTSTPPPPMDAGHPVDTGVPSKDTGAPPMDAGHDAGGPADSGSDAAPG